MPVSATESHTEPVREPERNANVHVQLQYTGEQFRGARRSKTGGPYHSGTVTQTTPGAKQSFVFQWDALTSALVNPPKEHFFGEV